MTNVHYYALSFNHEYLLLLIVFHVAVLWWYWENGYLKIELDTVVSSIDCGSDVLWTFVVWRMQSTWDNMVLLLTKNELYSLFTINKFKCKSLSIPDYYEHVDIFIILLSVSWTFFLWSHRVILSASMNGLWY